MDILTPEQIDYLSSALDSRLNEQAKNLILYYDLCQYDHLVYDFMTHLAFNEYVNGSLGLSKLDVETFLNKQQDRHPEILKWTATTRGKLAKELLAALTNFGILMANMLMRKTILLLLTRRLNHQGQTPYLLIKSCLRKFLDRNGYAIFWAVLGEKMTKNT